MRSFSKLNKRCPDGISFSDCRKYMNKTPRTRKNKGMKKKDMKKTGMKKKAPKKTGMNKRKRKRTLKAGKREKGKP